MIMDFESKNQNTTPKHWSIKAIRSNEYLPSFMSDLNIHKSNNFFKNKGFNVLSMSTSQNNTATFSGVTSSKYTTSRLKPSSKQTYKRLITALLINHQQTSVLTSKFST